MNYNKLYILLFSLVFILTGCHEDVEQPARMQMSICLPIQELVAPLQNRAMGDPGTTELFELPKYAYIFVTKDEGVGTPIIWHRKEVVLEEGNWIRTRYYGLNTTRGDSIYKYDMKQQWLLNGDHAEGKVYAICSNKKLNFDADITGISDENDLLNLKFSTAPDSIQENLQNIYSTPYNYERGGKYYCYYYCMENNSCAVDLLMYHIASKVDIKWYVADTVRINSSDPSRAVRLTYMDALNLYTGDAYCFKPMENVAATVFTSDRTIHLVRPEDEGLWWEGRAYFYTIPYTLSNSSTPGTYFPLQMLLRTNDSNADYKPTIQLSVNATEPFVPWLRANFNLSKPLDAWEGTKTANND